MIEKLPYESGFMLSCDTCPWCEEFEVGNNWDALIEESKEKGWRFKQNKHGEWEHYCPACVEEYRERKHRKAQYEKGICDDIVDEVDNEH